MGICAIARNHSAEIVNGLNEFGFANSPLEA